MLVVAPVDGDAGARALVAALRSSPGVDREDARIAAAAAIHAVPLVTEDRALSPAAGLHAPGLAVWDWAGGLRPRIVALSADERGILTP